MQKREFFKSESSVVTVDVRNKKIKTRTEIYVDQNLDQFKSTRSETLDIPPHIIFQSVIL